MELKTYPKYMNHRDHDEPVRVDSKAEQTDMENTGWTTARIFKEYPKYVEGKIVYSRIEEDRLIESKRNEEVVPSTDKLFDPVREADTQILGDTAKFSVTKETQVNGQDTVILEKPKKPVGRPKGK